MEIYQFRAMDTEFLLAGLPWEKASQAEKKIKYFARNFSRFIEDNELDYVNRHAGSFVQVSNEFYQCAKRAWELFYQTQGVFNPFLNKTIAGLGYDVSFAELAGTDRQPVKSDLLGFPWETAEVISWRPGRELKLHPMLQLDFGGIAKGWSGQFIAAWAKADVAQGVVDAGGDLVWWRRAIDQPMTIGLADPFKQEEDALDLVVAEAGCVATSSIRKRSWTLADGTPVHHIIDPQTMRPAESDLVQVSVFAPDLPTAEAYAKYMLIAGWEKGSVKLNELQEMACIGFDQQGNVRRAGNLTKYIIKGVR